MLFDLGAEEILRHLQMDAGAVAGLAVGVDRAAMPDRFQRLDGADDDFAPRLAVDGRDQAHAAGIVFLIGRIGVGGFQLLRVGDVAGDFGFAGFRASAPHPERYALRPPRAGEVKGWSGISSPNAEGACER